VLGYQELRAYADMIIKDCLQIGQGLGRFKLGEPLDKQFLDERAKLL